MIEMQALRYVTAAAETGSFNRAADRFGIKQSTLSKSVSYLETRLGIALFRRSTHGVAPTDPGRHFIRRMQIIVDDLDRLASDANAWARGARGMLRIGFHSSLASGELGTMIRAFRERYPDVEIDARERNRAELIGAVERGDLDLAVTSGTPPPATLCSLRMWSEPLIAALAADHPLAATGQLHWADLRGAEFVISTDDPGPDIGAIIAARLAGMGLRPSIRSQRVSCDNLLSFVGGNRVAIGTGFLARRGPTAPALHYIEDGYGRSAIEQAAQWRGDNENAALKNFRALLAERYGEPFKT
jgi:DNA-binding transcriptional LysR family regulator